MKKFLAILLAVAMLFAFAACSNNKTEDDTASTTAAAETSSDAADEAEPLNFDSVGDDETIEIVFPATFYDEENPATDKLSQEQLDSGFETATVNDDGSVTYTMNGKNYKTFMQQLSEETKQAFEGVIQSYPTIKKIDCNANFTTIVIVVDAEEFRANPMANISSMLQISNYIEIYYACVGDRIENYHGTISVVDEATGELLGTQPIPAEEEAAVE